MRRIWMRVGGYVRVRTDGELKDILGGDTCMLMECIRRDGFDICGDAYIPAEGNPELHLDDNIDFTL